MLQGLYERQLAGNAAQMPSRRISPRAAATSRADQPYFDELWARRGRATTTRSSTASRRTSTASRELLSPIERAILVIGAWELTHRLEIPYRVVINEAVELAKSFGGTDGHKFVNGVLDKLAARRARGRDRRDGARAGRGTVDDGTCHVLR